MPSQATTVIDGQTASSGGGGSEDHPAVVLEQGREVVFEVTNISTMTAFYGLHLVFFEERRD